MPRMASRELAISMASDSNSTADRQLTATEVRRLVDHLVSLGNTAAGDRYAFAGFVNAAAPFTTVTDAATGRVTAVNYGGDGAALTTPINTSSALTFNLTGNQVFQGAGVRGGVNLFDAVIDLERVLAGSSASNSLKLGVNLDSGAVPPGTNLTTLGPADTIANWLGAANFSTNVTIFDSKGQAHVLTLLFATSAVPNQVNYSVLINYGELVGGSATQLYEVGDGTLAFNPGGSFNAGASTVNAIDIGGVTPDFANGANSFVIQGANVDFSASTRLAQAFSVNTLSETNASGFNEQIGRLDAAIEQVLRFRTEAGVRLGAAESARESIGATRLRMETLRAELEEADTLEAISDFARLEQAFEAALQSASRIMQPSLLDFLR